MHPKRAPQAGLGYRNKIHRHRMLEQQSIETINEDYLYNRSGDYS